MLRTFIEVKWIQEGWHQWKDAPVEVDFLKPRHRHLFVIRAKIPVSHDDRQLEFFLVKNYLQSALLKRFPSGEFRSFSCEMIAKFVLEDIIVAYGIKKDISVSVHEDDENGSFVQN